MPGAAEQSDVWQWWQRAAVGVLSSENEGMPVCLMEAAACGVPVVAPAVGGIPELVSDGETGLLARPNDLESLVAALERLLRDGELRGRLGAAARQRAQEKFSVRHQVDSLLALWSEVLDARLDFGCCCDRNTHSADQRERSFPGRSRCGLANGRGGA